MSDPAPAAYPAADGEQEPSLDGAAHDKSSTERREALRALALLAGELEDRHLGYLAGAVRQAARYIATTIPNPPTAARSAGDGRCAYCGRRLPSGRGQGRPSKYCAGCRRDAAYLRKTVRKVDARAALDQR
jgi:hypothetical protein